MRTLIKIAALFLSLTLTACANQPTEETSAAQVSSDVAASYRAYFFTDHTYDKLFDVAQYSLAQNGFAITKVDKDGRKIAGQFALSTSKKTIHASVQFKPEDKGIGVVVVAENKPELGVGSGDDIAVRVLQTMREYSGDY